MSARASQFFESSLSSEQSDHSSSDNEETRAVRFNSSNLLDTVAIDNKHDNQLGYTPNLGNDNIIPNFNRKSKKKLYYAI